MMNEINIKIEITVSKIMAFTILILSFIASIHLKETSVITVGIGAASAIIANKQYQDRVKLIKKPEDENLAKS